MQQLQVVGKEFNESLNGEGRNLASVPVTLHTGEQKRLRNAISERVYSLTRYKAGARPLLFRLLYLALKERFAVASYRDIEQYQLQDALRFVAHWGEKIEHKRSNLS